MSQEILGKGISISKEGINRRINEKSVSLLKDILNQVLSINLSPINSIKSNFSSIVLTDATSFQLPECLNDSYSGFGGNHGRKGGVKVQYQISLTDGVTKTEITSATTNDQKSTIIQPKENELHLFDLGYFSLARLKEFDEKGAYYLCRLKTNTIVSILTEGDFKLFDWQKTPKNFKVGETIELAVCLGNKREVKTRLFVSKLDKKNADEKRRKLRRYYQRHGRKPSKKNLKCCDFTFHISNVPKKELSKDNAQKMYSLRWQIEIQFKTWKSFMNIDKVSHMNQCRFECHHYGSLIFILLTSKILQAYKYAYWEAEQVELSELKAMKFLSIQKELIWKMILGTNKEAKIAAESISKTLRKTCIKEVRKGKKSPLEIIENCLS